MDFWTVAAAPHLAEVKVYKAQEEERRERCLHLDYDHYVECTKRLQANWQSFILRIEWERRRVNDCASKAMKARVADEKELSRMCCSKVGEHVAQYFELLKEADQLILINK